MIWSRMFIPDPGVKKHLIAEPQHWGWVYRNNTDIGNPWPVIRIRKSKKSSNPLLLVPNYSTFFSILLKLEGEKRGKNCGNITYAKIHESCRKLAVNPKQEQLYFSGIKCCDGNSKKSTDTNTWEFFMVRKAKLSTKREKWRNFMKKELPEAIARTSFLGA